jgi:hypothetical protein
MDTNIRSIAPQGGIASKKNEVNFSWPITSPAAGRRRVVPSTGRDANTTGTNRGEHSVSTRAGSYLRSTRNDGSYGTKQKDDHSRSKAHTNGTEPSKQSGRKRLSSRPQTSHLHNGIGFLCIPPLAVRPRTRMKVTRRLMRQRPETQASRLPSKRVSWEAPQQMVEIPGRPASLHSYESHAMNADVYRDIYMADIPPHPHSYAAQSISMTATSAQPSTNTSGLYPAAPLVTTPSRLALPRLVSKGLHRVSALKPTTKPLQISWPMQREQNHGLSGAQPYEDIETVFPPPSPGTQLPRPVVDAVRAGTVVGRSKPNRGSSRKALGSVLKKFGSIATRNGNPGTGSSERYQDLPSDHEPLLDVTQSWPDHDTDDSNASAVQVVSRPQQDPSCERSARRRSRESSISSNAPQDETEQARTARHRRRTYQILDSVLITSSPHSTSSESSMDGTFIHTDQIRPSDEPTSSARRLATTFSSRRKPAGSWRKEPSNDPQDPHCPNSRPARHTAPLWIDVASSNVSNGKAPHIDSSGSATSTTSAAQTSSDRVRKGTQTHVTVPARMSHLTDVSAKSMATKHRITHSREPQVNGSLLDSPTIDPVAFKPTSMYTGASDTSGPMPKKKSETSSSDSSLAAKASVLRHGKQLKVLNEFEMAHAVQGAPSEALSQLSLGLSAAQKQALKPVPLHLHARRRGLVAEDRAPSHALEDYEATPSALAMNTPSGQQLPKRTSLADQHRPDQILYVAMDQAPPIPPRSVLRPRAYKDGMLELVLEPSNSIIANETMSRVPSLAGPSIDSTPTTAQPASWSDEEADIFAAYGQVEDDTAASHPLPPSQEDILNNAGALFPGPNPGSKYNKVTDGHEIEADLPNSTSTTGIRTATTSPSTSSFSSTSSKRNSAAERMKCELRRRNKLAQLLGEDVNDVERREIRRRNKISQILGPEAADAEQLRAHALREARNGKKRTEHIQSVVRGAREEFLRKELEERRLERRVEIEQQSTDDQEIRVAEGWSDDGFDEMREAKRLEAARAAAEPDASEMATTQTATGEAAGKEVEAEGDEEAARMARVQNIMAALRRESMLL